jgi:hypothetical protein
MQPLIVLLLVPLLIGAVFGATLRDIPKATLASAVIAPMLVFVCIIALNPGDSWNWLATLLVSPLVIAIALTAVLVCSRPVRTSKHRAHEA